MKFIRIGFNLYLVSLPEELTSSLNAKPLMVASAPGRLDFLNTHQDYKGLPVVPVAINLRTYVAIISENERFEATSLNLQKEGVESRDVFEPSNPGLITGRWWGNYLRACVIALERFKGTRLPKGLRLVIYSEVPVASGLSSSAALEVAFLKALDAYYNIGLTPEEIAEIAFRAENEVAGIPCGRLDQYASSLGGAILLYPRPPVHAERLEIGSIGFIVVDSGIRHSVADIHPKRQSELNEALRVLRSLKDVPPYIRSKIGLSFADTLWEELSFKEVEGYLSRLPRNLANRVAFTILMHESTMRVIEKIRRGMLDFPTLVHEVNYQHELLRDLYEVSLPELEKIREAMLKAGAPAVKISGAGMGGSLLALAPPDTKVKENIIQSALDNGAKKGWQVSIDRGASVDFTIS